MRESNQYKFRAECQTDVIEFLCAIHKACSKLLLREFVAVTEWDSDHPCPAVTVTIATNIPLWKVRNVMVAVPDGHVMVETLRLEAEYTGERTYV